MNTLKKLFLVLVVACAFVTIAMQFDANAAPYRKVFVTKHVSKVYPDLRTVERFINVAAHRPHKIKRFMRRNDIFKLDKGTRVIRVGSVLLDGGDTVVYKVRIPSLQEYGYIFSRNLKKAKRYDECVVEHRVKHKHKVKCNGKHKKKHKVKYVEKYVEEYVEEDYHQPTVKFKAIIETPALVLNFL